MTLFALLGVIILFALSIFQALLAVGRPYGNYAWGGQHTILPKKLRIASGFSIILYFIFAIFLVNRARLINIIPESFFVEAAMWVLTGYFVVSILMNAVSKNKKERLVMTPLSALLALSYLITALS